MYLKFIQNNVHDMKTKGLLKNVQLNITTRL